MPLPSRSIKTGKTLKLGFAILGVMASHALPGASFAQDANGLLIVDCLLPGRVQRLGTAATYVTARRAIKTSATDCRIRGGEYTEAGKASYASLMRVWLPLAKGGDVEAQTNLGEIFERGIGGPPQPDLAFEWYQLAAAKGFARAQVNLGSLYERGVGVSRDTAQAMQWYRKASGLNDLAIGTNSQSEMVNLRRERDDLAYQLEAERGRRQQLELEINQLNRQLEGNRSSLRDQEQRLAAARRDLANREQEFARQNADASARQSDRPDPEVVRNLAVLQNQMEGQRRSVADRDAQISRLRASVQLMEQRSTELQGALMQSEQRRQTEVASAHGETSAARRDLAQMGERLRAANEQLSGRLAMIDQQRTEADRLRQQLGSQSEASGAGASDRAALQVSLRRTETELATSRREVDELNGQIAKLQQQFASASRSSAPAAPVPAPKLAAVDINFGHYVALVIGNDNYRYGPKLRNPVNDARSVADVLRSRYGFETVVLLDADRYQILSALNAMREKLTSSDNLLVYYAGHGELDAENDRGYWLPVDAELNSNANWIASYQITDILKATAAKQIMVVSDSCFSGMLTRSGMTRLGTGMTDDEQQRWYRTMAGKHARVVLSSGGTTKVTDVGGNGHSVFAEAFLQALQSNRGILEGQKLSQLVIQRVAIAPAAARLEQVPIYAPLSLAGHEAGDFFFVPVN